MSATWETEIEGMRFETSQVNKVSKTLFKKKTKLGISTNPSYLRGRRIVVPGGQK
jgi:hypothetical protein